MKTFSKYIFEVVVIFIGITMSFLFEEWRSSRQDDHKEREYYELLLADIKEDSISLEEVFEGIRFEQPRLDSILFADYKRGGQFSIDMCAAFGFKPQQNFLKAFESIKQSGDLKSIKSKTLIKKCNLILTKQAALNQFIRAEESVRTDYRKYLAEKYPDMAMFCGRWESGVKRGKITEADKNRFLNDPQIVVFYNKQRWIARTVNGLAAELKNDLTELGEELKKLG